MRKQIWETKVTWLRPHTWAITKWKTNVPVLSILKKLEDSRSWEKVKELISGQGS